VGGSVDAQVSDLVLAPGAAVQGQIAYTSSKELTVAPGAQVEGTVQRAVPPSRTPDPWVIAGIDSLAAIRAFIGLAAFGAVFVLLFPHASMTSVETGQRHWLASLGLGFGLLVAVPVLALLVLLIGIVIGGWWISLVALAGYVVLTVLGYLTASLFTGGVVAQWAHWQLHPAWQLLIGLAIVDLVTLIPFVGPLVGFLAVVVGTGALALTAWSAYQKPAAVVAAPISVRGPAVTPVPVAS